MLSHLGDILEQLGDTMGPKSDKISQDSGQERQHEPTQRENAAAGVDPESARRAAERAGEDLGGVTENYNTETLDNLPTSLTRSWAPTGPVRI